ncbi:InlB B-repeat-containing protein [Pedobacter sp. JCM 36344]|uniref:InlB B-repeat-containing protein n=1 Tax=Pedobacter sp. JCM 36344 TaxID=3374280 RepID=UPI00397B6980
MKKTFTSNGVNNSVRQPQRYLKLLTIIISSMVVLTSFVIGCKKDDFKGEVFGDCPVVVSTDPMDKAVDVVVNKLISITFNTDMDATTINSTTLIIKQGANLISGKVESTDNPKTFTFKPDMALSPFVVYNGTVTTGAKDLFHTAMVADYLWSFTTIPNVTLSVLPVLGGTTTGAGSFAQGSTTTVTAAPNTGFTFTSWTENGTVVSTSSSYQFTMAGNRALVANFTAIPAGSVAVLLSSNPTAGGTNSGSGAYAIGSTVTIASVANAGFTFVSWTENGTIVSPSSSYSFVIASNRNFVANYKAVPSSQFAVVLTSNPTAGGTTDGEGSYASGTSVTITAAQNTGYTFANWTDKISGVVVSTSPKYLFALTTNRSFVANFVINTYLLNVTAVNGVVVKNPNQPTYNHGTQVLLTATANPGYVFSSWSGNASGSANPLTVIMNDDKNITANFTLIPPPSILGSAALFGAFGGNKGITNDGLFTVINNGSIGTTAASSLITGFHDGTTNDVYTETPLNKGNVTGRIYTAPPAPGDATSFAIAQQALLDARKAYDAISPASKPGGIDPGAGELGGLTLAPGVYKSASGTFKITNGTLTLDAKGDPNAEWVFQTAASLTVGIAGPAGARSVVIINGGFAKNVYWYVGSAATINGAGGGVMTGTIISTAGVTFSTVGNVVQTVLNGRALSLVASVTMVNTTINVPQ